MKYPNYAARTENYLDSYMHNTIKYFKYFLHSNIFISFERSNCLTRINKSKLNGRQVISHNKL
jgi:hypothetical protein